LSSAIDHLHRYALRPVVTNGTVLGRLAGGVLDVFQGLGDPIVL